MTLNKIFSQEEVAYISNKRPDLLPLKVPSISDANLLSEPSVNQIILEFLKQFDVNVQPREIGKWNGWDTIATFDSIMNRGGSSIANTLFYTSRSNQVSQSAQDWQTWKRWALDHKDFSKYKDDIIQKINFHNTQVLAEIEKKIQEVKLNIKIANEVLMQPAAKEYIANLIKENQLKKQKKAYIWVGLFFVFIAITGLIVNNGSIDEIKEINRKRNFDSNYWQKDLL